MACKGRGEDRLPLEARAIQGTYGWGYEVLVDKKVFIHQEYIPAVQGYHGFSSKEDALRVASLAMNKIHLGKVPVISVHELDSLGIAIPRPAAPGSGH
ncbi:MAG TPA: DUF4907 domain-containing protein [Chitinophagaceae bacterium]|nr:DUF4907 domain-containing protein [Chitinophagaceae bacterium]